MVENMVRGCGFWTRISPHWIPLGGSFLHVPLLIGTLNNAASKRKIADRKYRATFGGPIALHGTIASPICACISNEIFHYFPSFLVMGIQNTAFPSQHWPSRLGLSAQR